MDKHQETHLLDTSSTSKNQPTTESRLTDTLIIGTWLIGKAEKTQITYKKVLKQFFAFYPNLSVQTTKTAHISVFIKSLEKEGAKATSLNLYLNALSSLFKSALKQERIEIDPTSALKNYRVASTVHEKVLSLEQIQQMIRKETRERNILLIKWLFYLGLRAGEVVEIKISDFVARGEGMVLFIKGKGSKIRQSPISDDLWSEIDIYREKWGLRNSDYLFFDEKNKGKKLSTMAIWKAIKSSAKKAKVEPLPSPHWFRHTGATLALEGGAPVHVVQARLGHASLSTTSRYLHAKASEGLGQYLPKIEEG